MMRDIAKLTTRKYEDIAGEEEEQMPEIFIFDHCSHDECSLMHGWPRSKRTETEYWQMDSIGQ